MIHVIDPFAQAKATRLGLGHDGYRRTVFKVVNASEFPVGGLTIFIDGPHGDLPRT
jgi:hypothetical protein